MYAYLGYPPETIDHWRLIHRDCHGNPTPIVDLAEAQFVLTRHGGHGGRCNQYAAGMACASKVVS